MDAPLDHAKMKFMLDMKREDRPSPPLPCETLSCHLCTYWEKNRHTPSLFDPSPLLSSG